MEEADNDRVQLGLTELTGYNFGLHWYINNTMLPDNVYLQSFIFCYLTCCKPFYFSIQKITPNNSRAYIEPSAFFCKNIKPQDKNRFLKYKEQLFSFNLKID